MSYVVRIPANSFRSTGLRPSSSTHALALKLLVGITAVLLTFLYIPVEYVGFALLGVVASAAVVYIVAGVLHGRVDNVLLAWLLVSPLAYCCLSLPVDHPIFTFDRLVLLILTGALLFANRSSVTAMPLDLKRAAIVWAVFIAFAFASMNGVWDTVGLGGTRVIIDAFIFPGVLALFVIRMFPVQRYLRTIHTLIGLTAMYCAAIGLVEIVTNTDLLPIPDDTFYTAEQTGAFARVNGPFAANHCLGAIGVVILFLLLFIRTVMPATPTRRQLWFHRASVGAALAMVLLPQFRSLLIGLVIVTLLELYQNRQVRSRLSVVAAVLLLIIAMVSLPALLPTYFENRVSDLSNVYGRIAQQQQTWEMFAMHPWNGVGFWNFIESSERASSTTFHDIQSLNSPHNSVGSILAETGIAGCIPFIVANALWVFAFFRLRKSTLPIARNAFRFSLYIFICYWTVGLTLTSAYEHDLNLWYMFACAVMYKMALVERDNPQLSTGLH